jgi:cullin 1
MFIAFDRGNLERLYRLFSLVPDCLPNVASHLKKYVESEVNTLYEGRKARIVSLKEQKPPKKEKPDDPEFMQAMIELHGRIVSLVDKQFANNKLFKNASKVGFTNMLSKDVSKTFSNAEIISTYADRILKGGEKLGDFQMQVQLEKIISIFYYLPDKDTFAEIYRNQLAKRLLNRRSASMDAEKQMISLLKQQCGAPLTSKLEGMTRDLALGEDRRKELQAYMNEKGLQFPIEFHMELLSSGFWPSYKPLKLNLPSELSTTVSQVEDWYKGTNSHRTLTWIYSVGDVSVKRRFAIDGGMKSHEFTVTTMQAIVLLMFNNVDLDKDIGFNEIKHKIGDNIDDLSVKPVLHSLACGKFKLLTKVPDSKRIEDTDVFRFNQNFKSKVNKFRVPVATIEPTHDMKRVKEDRSFAVDACIVRIMKARKQLQHNELLTEVVRQFQNFEPQPRLIKQRIETLIEREYLQRDTDDQKLYRYLA